MSYNCHYDYVYFVIVMLFRETPDCYEFPWLVGGNEAKETLVLRWTHLLPFEGIGRSKGSLATTHVGRSTKPDKIPLIEPVMEPLRPEGCFLVVSLGSNCQRNRVLGRKINPAAKPEPKKPSTLVVTKWQPH